MKFSKLWLLLTVIAVFEAYGFRGGLVWAGSVNIILAGLVEAVLAFLVILIAWSILNWIKGRSKEKESKYRMTLSSGSA